MQLPNGSKQKWTYTMKMVDQDIAILVGIGGAIENYPGIFEKLGMLPTTIQELMWLSAQPDVSP